MSTHTSHSPRFPLFRRLWKPAAVTGAGGTAAVLWFEEILAFGADILALIFLPLIAGTIYLLDNFIFKSCMPCREDMNDLSEGEKK